MPPAHRPGHSQVDFGGAGGYIGGKKIRFYYFCLDVPHSETCRKQFCTAVPGLRWRRYCAMASTDGPKPLRNCRATTCLTTNYVPPAKGNDKSKVAGLCELERIDCERRTMRRRIRLARFSVTKSPDTFDFIAMPSLNGENRTYRS